MAIDFVIFFVALAWPFGVGLVCLRFTKRFIRWFLLSFAIAMAPIVVLALEAYDGFTEPAIDLMQKAAKWIPISNLSVYSYFRFYKSDARKKCLCSACDYDLTGNESGNCPECGTAIESV